MQDWIPKPARGVDPRKHKLTVEEGFVLSRLDGVTTASQLAAVTGLPAERVRGILARLMSQGLVQRAPAGLPKISHALGDHAVPTEEHAIPAMPEESLATLELSPDDIIQEDPGPEVVTQPDFRRRKAPQEAAAAEATQDAIEDTVEDATAGVAAEAAAEGAPAEGEADPTPESEAEEIKGDGSFRALFETKLHKLPADERAALAQTAGDAELCALCFDPTPLVIKSVLQHPRVGLSHARLIARHHRNPIGLEAVAQRAAFAADSGVRRWLLRNPQLPAGLFRRLWAGRRMMEQQKIAMDRDVPEQTRRAARELLRQRFTNGPAEEKVELILNTEGRVLGALAGLPIDGKTTSLLCARTYRSVTLIQNLARWSAAPPLLIAHLLKQDAVRRSPSLRTMLLRHPNTPSHAKQRDDG